MSNGYLLRAEMAETWLAVGFLVVGLTLVLLLASREPKKNKKPRYKGMSGALGAITELYQPTAQSAAQIVEEQSKARKQHGNEDKKKPQSK